MVFVQLSLLSGFFTLFHSLAAISLGSLEKLQRFRSLFLSTTDRTSFCHRFYPGSLQLPVHFLIYHLNVVLMMSLTVFVPASLWAVWWHGTICRHFSRTSFNFPNECDKWKDGWLVITAKGHAPVNLINDALFGPGWTMGAANAGYLPLFAYT